MPKAAPRKPDRMALSPTWAAVVSAVLLLGAFAPFDLALLVFVALVPWLRSLADTDGRGAFRSGYVFGLVFMGGQLFWLQQFVAGWTQSVWLGIVPWVLATAAGALYFAATGWMIHGCWKGGRPWAIPIVWAGVEVLRSYILVLAFPWGLVATPLWQLTPMIQTAHYATIYGVSAWIVLANLVGARFLRGEGLSSMRTQAMAFVAILTFSLVRYGTPAEGELTTITIGQPGVDLAFGDPAAEGGALALSVAEMTVAAVDAQAKFLVLPEGVARGGGFPPQPPFAIVPEMPVVFGGQRGNGPAYQTAFAYDGEWRYADKTRLVIFGEFVPLRGVLPFLDAFNVPGGDLTPAENVEAIDVAGVRVGPLLCFEGLFYDVAHKQTLNGARLLVQMSIDDWYMGTTAPDQLRAATSYRAIESGVPLVRSASLGYSLAVDARGDLVAQAPLKKQVATTVRLLLPAVPDTFPGLPMFPWLASLSVPLVAAMAWKSGRKTPPGG